MRRCSKFSSTMFAYLYIKVLEKERDNLLFTSSRLPCINSGLQILEQDTGTQRCYNII